MIPSLQSLSVFLILFFLLIMGSFEPTYIAIADNATATSASNAQDQIAFASNRNGAFNIFVMNPDGSNVRQLTKNTQDSLYPAWSPDGRYIAYLRANTIYIIDVASKQESQLIDRVAGGNRIAWSPDSKQLGFVSMGGEFSDIYIIDIDGSNLRRLTKSPPSNIYGITWSPDGQYIAFSIRYLADTKHNLRVVRVSDKVQRQLTTIDGWEPAWSPNGKFIAFTAESIRNDPTI